MNSDTRSRSGWALTLAAWMLGWVAIAGAQAGEVCGEPDERGVQLCRAGLSVEQIERIRSTQQKSQWCWAASIEMIFGHHGIQISQSELAKVQFGAETDQGVSGPAMTALLERQDPQTRKFLMVDGAADRAARRFDLRNASVVEELAEGRPLLVGVKRHAMVLVAVVYERFTREDALRVVGGTVIDPEPGQGVRALARDELRPTYLAAVQPPGARQWVRAATLARQ